MNRVLYVCLSTVIVCADSDRSQNSTTSAVESPFVSLTANLACSAESPMNPPFQQPISPDEPVPHAQAQNGFQASGSQHMLIGTRTAKKERPEYVAWSYIALKDYANVTVLGTIWHDCPMVYEAEYPSDGVLYTNIFSIPEFRGPKDGFVVDRQGNIYYYRTPQESIDWGYKPGGVWVKYRSGVLHYVSSEVIKHEYV